MPENDVIDNNEPNTPAAPAAPVEPAAPATPAAPAAPATPEAPAAPAATGDEDKPQVFDAKYVEKLRAENAKHRKAVETAREEGATAAAKAAEEAAEKARQEFAQTIGRAAGLVTDEEKPVDPQELIAAATAREEAATARAQADALAARAAKVELALYRASDKASADSGALLDSRSFLDSVSGLDPAADDFAAQVEAAVAKAVEDNPKYRKTPARVAPARSGADLTAGHASTEPIGDGTSVKELQELRRKRRGLS